ncbi:MAG: 4-hydroxy-tetrahydrodipicolinate synthase [Dehalococcoidia bacterium]|nr:4-hydroxy-tetrahydrodipicolinate synthase [Dehalococcoidia bacterium]MCK4262763.1 4-hydroxy-tetrahydrodipicolinate synthase [Dehalococcoidia bacterium]MCK4579767.1 4-hydroxy-tetrahydrodipicolinate synthase [Dehalococcoidia bacterium]
MERLGRLLTAMVTPFDVEGEVDYQQARNLARALVDSGSEGLVVSGSTGESPTLSFEEKLRLFAEVKSVVGQRGAVVAGTGSYNTKESQELTKEAEKAGVDACLLVVPYYNRPTQEGLFEHFSAIAGSTRLPCIIYNVPSRTSTNITADTVLKLSQVNNIVGVKEASANFRQIAEIIQGTRDDFLVYSGNDGDTLLILALGGYGVVGVATHLVGVQVQDMMDKFLRGETREAAAIHRQLLPLVDSLFVVSNPIPLKYALNYLGFQVGKPRLPLVEADPKSAELIRTALKRCKIDLAVSPGASAAE